jgi:hypothetical protein
MSLLLERGCHLDKRLVMKIGQEILKKIENIISVHDFTIVTVGDMELKLQSKHRTLIFYRSQYERANFFWIGRNNNLMIEVTDEVLHNFFSLNISFLKVTPREFIDNVCYFLESEKLLLNDESSYLSKLEQYVYLENKKYNYNLAERIKARRALRDNNIKEFIEIIKRLDYKDLPVDLQSKFDKLMANNNRL